MTEYSELQRAIGNALLFSDAKSPVGPYILIQFAYFGDSAEATVYATDGLCIFHESVTIPSKGGHISVTYMRLSLKAARAAMRGASVIEGELFSEESALWDKVMVYRYELRVGALDSFDFALGDLKLIAWMKLPGDAPLTQRSWITKDGDPVMGFSSGSLEVLVSSTRVLNSITGYEKGKQ